MIRSLVVAIVTVVLVSALSPVGEIAAQPANVTSQPVKFPLAFTNAPPGVNIELFLNSAKLADVTVSVTGDASWVLDMGNMSKTRVQIYIDVCKDGKIVKVMFVTGNGQPPPKDQDCDRRLVAAGFQSDCGVTRITIDLTQFGAQIVGCAGNPITRPLVYGPIAAGAVLLGLLAGGGDGATTSSVTPTPVATPAPTPTPTPTPAPAPAPTPATFTVTLVMSFTHPPGTNSSFVCGVIMTNPTQPGATHTVVLSGPAVAPNQNISGTLTPSGQAAFRGQILQVGSYTASVTVRSTTNVQSTATGMVNVTGGNSSCPAAQ